MLSLVIIALASFRITRLITTDLIFEPVREWLLMRWPNDDENYTWQLHQSGSWWRSGGWWIKQASEPARSPTMFGRLISCDYCISVWLVIPVYLLDKYVHDVALIAASAGLVYLLASHINRGID